MSDHIICAGRRPSVVIQNLRSALTYLKFRRKLVGGQEKMAEHYLGIEDAWMNEAQEMSNMVEDIESKIKNEDLENQKRLTDNSKSKLFQVGIKLDRLDSLLHNPHSKPIFGFAEQRKIWNSGGTCFQNSGEEQDHWLSLSIHHPLQRDHMKSFFYLDDLDMHKPLIVSDEATQSRDQMRQSGCYTIITVLRILGWIICLVLGGAALLFLLIIICSLL
ncbi:uncharacterized protein [Euphorbia lathyris]|uniref:uncharacterized protein isoform X1 n=1 Tax=Euphorbia lathyris TaxID=212925 RepID=UPI00331417D4